MSRKRINPPPPKLTPEVTRAITTRAKEPNPPGAFLDWIAQCAGVKRNTVRRWCKEAYRIKHRRLDGATARKWIKFADAVDELMAAGANWTVEGIQEIAGDDESKKRLDALIYLDKRYLREEERLDSLDVEPSEDNSVAHIPQEYFDALTDAERDAQDADLELLMEVQARVAARWDAAAARVDDAPDVDAT